MEDGWVGEMDDDSDVRDAHGHSSCLYLMFSTLSQSRSNVAILELVVVARRGFSVHTPFVAAAVAIRRSLRQKGWCETAQNVSIAQRTIECHESPLNGLERE